MISLVAWYAWFGDQNKYVCDVDGWNVQLDHVRSVRVDSVRPFLRHSSPEPKSLLFSVRCIQINSDRTESRCVSVCLCTLVIDDELCT